MTTPDPTDLEAVRRRLDLRRRAEAMRPHITEIAVYRNWPQDEVRRCHRALDRLDFKELDVILSRLDPPPPP